MTSTTRMKSIIIRNLIRTTTTTIPLFAKEKSSRKVGIIRKTIDRSNNTTKKKNNDHLECSIGSSMITSRCCIRPTITTTTTTRTMLTGTNVNDSLLLLRRDNHDDDDDNINNSTNNQAYDDESEYWFKRRQFQKEIQSLPEYHAERALIDFFQRNHYYYKGIEPPTPPIGGYRHEMTNEQMRISYDAALTTFALYVESRIASLIGYGYYTIGPCGEELLAPSGLVFNHNNKNQLDSIALHYRHLAINIANNLTSSTTITTSTTTKPNDDTTGNSNSNSSFCYLSSIPYNDKLQQIIMDRARGYTVSKYDPVTGGVHCSIGGGMNDYIVTSTLASQCPSAVGRALGYSLIQQQQQQQQQQHDVIIANKVRPISFVTIGDGSVHNHHFLSSYHLARHAHHKNIKCPIVFGISDNGLSISYKTNGYVHTMFGNNNNNNNNNNNDPLIPVYKANGNDMMDVYSQTMAATQYTRKQSAPSVLLYEGIVRRFGHAASDRQLAYLSVDDIQKRISSTYLESAAKQMIDVYNVYNTYQEIYDRYYEIQRMVRKAFIKASVEPKVSRDDMLRIVRAPLVPIPKLPDQISNNIETLNNKQNGRNETDLYDTNTSNITNKKLQKTDVMRKHMTRVIAEVMKLDPSIVYLGEDVIHGGYYVVTENLAKQYPGRVIDFPPDETSLLGAAMGFAQLGLLPIVEIPYSKYLDCGADMFYEIAISYWLSAGQRPNGMLIRLQGFDKGLFGGNFHTTNLLQHIPPGVDVVCYSNGEDYVRGFRYSIQQAKVGRVVMSVDCTHLLNLRHIHPEDKDRAWERPYPQLNDGDESGATKMMMGFDEVRRYGNCGSSCIVTYGNGVVTALQARRELAAKGVITSEGDLDILDCPYLSEVPGGLRQLLKSGSQYHAILFADICKDGPGGSVLTSHVCSLRQEGILPEHWGIVCAPRTYNPLGNISTFLNVEDIVNSYHQLIKQVVSHRKPV